MGDNQGPQPIDLATLLHTITDGQRSTTDTVNALGMAVQTLLSVESNRNLRSPTTHGPKVREPRTYDGDRSDGKLDDHIRDIENWVAFYDARGHWRDETEKVRQAATYLTGRIHRMYTLQRDAISTIPDYLEWLRNTFRDANEQARLREDWQRCHQGRRTVYEYASDLIYLATRIRPDKSENEIKEHFRAGLDARILLKLAEHPEWDGLSLQEFIGRADRVHQIEQERDFIRKRTNTSTYDQVFALSSYPRRGGRGPGVLTRQPRRDTQEWRDQCRKNNACFSCGQPGHARRDCSQTKTTGGNLKRQPGTVPTKPPQRGVNGRYQGKVRA